MEIMENEKSKIEGVRLPPGGVYVMHPKICVALAANHLLTIPVMDAYSRCVKKIEIAILEFNEDIDGIIGNPTKPPNQH